LRGGRAKCIFAYSLRKATHEAERCLQGDWDEFIIIIIIIIIIIVVAHTPNPCCSLLPIFMQPADRPPLPTSNRQGLLTVKLSPVEIAEVADLTQSPVLVGTLL
jgi:hypothetical protein